MKNHIRQDIELYGKRILESKEFAAAFGQRHHYRTTVGDHSLRVTRASLRLLYLLEKLGLDLDHQSMVEAGLCHDLGMIGRKEKFKRGRDCIGLHPVHSAEIADRILGYKNPKRETIIRRHMWPLSKKAPHSWEEGIITVADKYASLVDVIKPKVKRHEDY